MDSSCQLPTLLGAQNMTDMKLLLENMTERVYAEFLQMVQFAPGMSDTDRKRALLSYLHSTRQQLLRLYSLGKCSSKLKTVEGCVDHDRILDKAATHARTIQTAADELFFAHVQLQQACLPMLDVHSALEVLSTGTYQDLPSSIEQLRPPPPPSPESKEASSAYVTYLINRRLLQANLPPDMRVISVADSCAIIACEGLYKARLTLIPAPDLPPPEAEPTAPLGIAPPPGPTPEPIRPSGTAPVSGTPIEPGTPLGTEPTVGTSLEAQADRTLRLVGVSGGVANAGGTQPLQPMETSPIKQEDGPSTSGREEAGPSAAALGSTYTAADAVRDLDKERSIQAPSTSAGHLGTGDLLDPDGVAGVPAVNCEKLPPEQRWYWCLISFVFLANASAGPQLQPSQVIELLKDLNDRLRLIADFAATEDALSVSQGNVMEFSRQSTPGPSEVSASLNSEQLSRPSTPAQVLPTGGEISAPLASMHAILRDIGGRLLVDSVRKAAEALTFSTRWAGNIRIEPSSTSNLKLGVRVVYWTRAYVIAKEPCSLISPAVEVGIHPNGSIQCINDFACAQAQSWEPLSIDVHRADVESLLLQAAGSAARHQLQLLERQLNTWLTVHHISPPCELRWMVGVVPPNEAAHLERNAMTADGQELLDSSVPVLDFSVGNTVLLRITKDLYNGRLVIRQGPDLGKQLQMEMITYCTQEEERLQHVCAAEAGKVDDSPLAPRLLNRLTEKLGAFLRDNYRTRAKQASITMGRRVCLHFSQPPQKLMVQYDRDHPGSCPLVTLEIKWAFEPCSLPSHFPPLTPVAPGTSSDSVPRSTFFFLGSGLPVTPRAGYCLIMCACNMREVPIKILKSIPVPACIYLPDWPEAYKPPAADASTPPLQPAATPSQPPTINPSTSPEPPSSSVFGHMPTPERAPSHTFQTTSISSIHPSTSVLGPSQVQANAPEGPALDEPRTSGAGHIANADSLAFETSTSWAGNTAAGASTVASPSISVMTPVRDVAHELTHVVRWCARRMVWERLTAQLRALGMEYIEYFTGTCQEPAGLITNIRSVQIPHQVRRRAGLPSASISRVALKLGTNVNQGEIMMVVEGTLFSDTDPSLGSDPCPSGRTPCQVGPSSCQASGRLHPNGGCQSRKCSIPLRLSSGSDVRWGPEGLTAVLYLNEGDSALDIMAVLVGVIRTQALLARLELTALEPLSLSVVSVPRKQGLPVVKIPNNVPKQPVYDPHSQFPMPFAMANGNMNHFHPSDKFDAGDAQPAKRIKLEQLNDVSITALKLQNGLVKSEEVLGTRDANPSLSSTGVSSKTELEAGVLTWRWQHTGIVNLRHYNCWSCVLDVLSLPVPSTSGNGESSTDPSKSNTSASIHESSSLRVYLRWFPEKRRSKADTNAEKTPGKSAATADDLPKPGWVMSCDQDVGQELLDELSDMVEEGEEGLMLDTLVRAAPPLVSLHSVLDPGTLSTAGIPPKGVNLLPSDSLFTRRMLCACRWRLTDEADNVLEAKPATVDVTFMAFGRTWLRLMLRSSLTLQSGGENGTTPGAAPKEQSRKALSQLIHRGREAFLSLGPGVQILPGSSSSEVWALSENQLLKERLLKLFASLSKE